MKKLVLITTLIIVNIVSVFSLEVPTLKGRINDYGGMLSSSEAKSLEQLLMQMESGTSSQIALLTIPSLEGESLEDFSIRVVDKWQLGVDGSDNGVLLLIALEERKIRIEVGYGLEHVLTDAKSDYIIRNILAPGLRSGDNYTALKDTMTAIYGLINGEYSISQKSITESEDRNGTGFPVSFIFIVLFIVFSSLGRRGFRGGRGSGMAGLIILNALLGGSSRSSGFSGRSSSGFGGGGFSGGGFSGGGGGFGGGGASGGW